MTIKKYIFLHTLKRIRILFFLLFLFLFHPISGYLRLFSRLQLAGRDWNETVKKQFFGSGGEVMNHAKKYQQLIFSCYELIPINAFRSLEVCIPAVARKSF